jgi:hypothetical protein
MPNCPESIQTITENVDWIEKEFPELGDGQKEKLLYKLVGFELKTLDAEMAFNRLALEINKSLLKELQIAHREIFPDMPPPVHVD